MGQGLVAPLVGMHFRPPAKLILEHLPSGCQLILVPEPDNPYDEKAIKVLVQPGQVPDTEYDELAEALPQMGFEIEDVLQRKAENPDPIHLGYIADSDGKLCKSRPSMAGNREVGRLLAELEGKTIVVTLGFEPDGKPVVIVEARE